MEMADMLDLGSNSERSAGSSPVRRTNILLLKDIMPTNGSVFRKADNAVKPFAGICLLKVNPVLRLKQFYVVLY